MGAKTFSERAAKSGLGFRRFLVGWDTNAAGRLKATTLGSPNITNILTATASAATNACHTHDLVSDPATREATCLFDGVRIQTWDGLSPAAKQNGTPQWGSGSSGGRGRMNYHHVQFAINGLGAVAEYDAGLSNAPLPNSRPVRVSRAEGVGNIGFKNSVKMHPASPLKGIDPLHVRSTDLIYAALNLRIIL